MGTRTYNRPDAAEIWAIIHRMVAHSAAAREEFEDTKGWSRTQLHQRARGLARMLVELGDMPPGVHRTLQEWLAEYPEAVSRKTRPVKGRQYTKYLGVWVTAEDWEAFEAHRKSLGLVRSEYFRRAIRLMQARDAA